eukprot:1101295-Prorocentrum_minimum.AAC.2
MRWNSQAGRDDGAVGALLALREGRQRKNSGHFDLKLDVAVLQWHSVSQCGGQDSNPRPTTPVKSQS